MGKREVVPVVELDNIPELVDSELEVLMINYRVAKEDKEKAKTWQKELGQEIHALLIATRQVKVGCGELVAVKCNGRSGARLDEHKLLEHGVDPDVIEECWVGGTSYTYVQVIKREVGNAQADSE